MKEAETNTKDGGEIVGDQRMKDEARIQKIRAREDDRQQGGTDDSPIHVPSLSARK